MRRGLFKLERQFWRIKVELWKLWECSTTPSEAQFIAEQFREIRKMLDAQQAYLKTYSAKPDQFPRHIVTKPKEPLHGCR